MVPVILFSNQDHHEFACHAVILSSSESIVAVITASHICLDCYTMQLLKENRQKEKRTKETKEHAMI
jgi:hypothetical protein